MRDCIEFYPKMCYNVRNENERGDYLLVNRKHLKLAMARACMSAQEVAKHAEIPRPTFNNAAIGRSVRPETLGKIARALGVDVEYLIAKEEC